MDHVIDFINLNRERYLEELKAFLAIPSISALPEHAPDVKRCAEWCADEMRRIGLQNVRLVDTPGNPVVYGDWIGAEGAPTILFYGHHDVQPVDPLDLWQSPPFEATVRDGRLYGRGTVDDKGQVWVHVKAIESFLRSAGGGRLPINLKLIVEGEEEVGSENLDGLLRAHADLLRADYVCVSDTAMFGRGIPSLCVGLRGLCYFEVRVHGPSLDVHSGSFGGGIANPANALAQILARMHDEDGRVTIPGFYD